MSESSPITGCEITYTVRVDAEPGAELTNTACLSLLLVEHQNPTTTRAFAQPACVAEDSETITVRQAVTPAFGEPDKSVDVETVRAGDPVTFTVTIPFTGGDATQTD